MKQLEDDNEPLVWTSVSSSTEQELDNDDEEYKPTGRNAKRAIARNSMFAYI